MDQLTAREALIFRAIPSRKWPGDASLEVAHVWLRKGDWSGEFMLDDQSVKAITSQLTSPGSVAGRPYRLMGNAGKSFQGSIVLGKGFVIEPDAAKALLDKDQRNSDVVFPYLNGEDLNSRWDQSPSRWVINFHDWPLERAREYPDCFEILERTMKSERLTKAADVASAPWWQFWRRRPELYRTIANLDRVLVGCQTAKYVSLAFQPCNYVFSHATNVFCSNRGSWLALLGSSHHDAWARKYSGSLETRLRYSPSDGFESFPFPEDMEELESIGERYESVRTNAMSIRREGLTVTYNRLHSSETSMHIDVLRDTVVEMDYAVSNAYGWGDLDLNHGYHATKLGVRFGISENARGRVLDRLLKLNQEGPKHPAKTEDQPKKKIQRKKSKDQIEMFQ